VIGADVIGRDEIPQVRLRDLVAQARGKGSAEICDWQCRAVHYDASSPISLGLYRVAGTGREDGASYSWSLILKVVRSPGGVEVLPGVVMPMWVNELPPDDASFWKREVLFYRSRVPEDLPGPVAAPRCFAVDEMTPNVFWMWLEDVADADQGRWSLSRYVETAHHLGQFNGAYLAGRPLPTEPCLQGGWLRSTFVPGRRASAWQRLPDDAWEHLLIRHAFPSSVRERLARLWSERDAFLDELDSLPATFCHRDAWPPNLFVRDRPEGGRETVALDWAFAGVGPVGEEIAPLIAWCSLPNIDLETVQEKVLDSYLSGLAQSGWVGDPATVRHGYAATAILRYSFICTTVAVRAALSLQQGEPEGAAGQASEEEMLRNTALVHYLLNLADKVRGSASSA
jgi:hypothetical protein